MTAPEGRSEAPSSDTWTISKTGCLRFFKSLIVAVAILYAAGFCVTLLLAVGVGQRSIFAVALMFAPPWVWFMPAVPVLLTSLWASRKLSLVLLGLWLFGAWSLGLRWNRTGDEDRSAQSVRIMTYNRGQSGGESLQPFKNAHGPDLLLMQEAGRRTQAYLDSDGYRELPHGLGAGEFTLLSRWPIQSGELIHAEDAAGAEKAIAARYVVESPSGRLAIYNVHFPSPRGSLSALRKGGALWGILGLLPVESWQNSRRSHQGFWNFYLIAAEHLSQLLEEEPLPYLVGGDFNSPAFGPVHRSLTHNSVDGHQELGRGWGHTFPGTTNNPIALFRPWLRLDWLLASQHWKFTQHVTEPDRASQHRAVFAALKRSDPDS